MDHPRNGRGSLLNLNRILKATVLIVFQLSTTNAFAEDALQQAVLSGIFQDVERAIRNGADVNAQDSDGRTALLNAALGYPRLKVIDALLKAGADVNAKDISGITALIWAVHPVGASNPDVVSLLLKAGADVNAKDGTGTTALMEALRHVEASNLEVVSLLLKAGADVNAKDNTGATALMEASSPDVVSLLLKAGADVKAKDNGGYTALMYALYHQNTRVTDALLKAGADVNAKGNDGVTALMAAALANQPEVINALIKAGADINAKSSNGATALMNAAYNNQNPKVIDALLRAGADVNAKSNNGGTALLNAALRNQNLEVTDALLKAGANVNVKNNAGITALMLAAGSNGPDVVSLLLKAGSDASAKDNTGLTALAYASGRNFAFLNTSAYRQLLAATQGDKTVQGSASRTFSLLVSVNVPGARVFVDGKEVAGSTPSVTVGNHRVQVIAGGYQPYDGAFTIDKPTQLTITLQPLKGTSNLTTQTPNPQRYASGSCVPEVDCTWEFQFSSFYSISLTNLSSRPRHLKVYVYSTENILLGDRDYEVHLGPYVDGVSSDHDSDHGLIAVEAKPAHFAYRVIELPDDRAQSAQDNSTQTQKSENQSKQKERTSDPSSLIGMWAGMDASDSFKELYFYKFDDDGTYSWGPQDQRESGTYTATGTQFILNHTATQDAGEEEPEDSPTGDETLQWTISGDTLTVTVNGLVSTYERRDSLPEWPSYP
jgi:uncharacterized protein